MMTRREIIRSKALELLRSAPDGIRYTELAETIQEAFPDIPNKTIYSSMWDLDKTMPNEVYKPARGVFRHIDFIEVVETGKEEEIGGGRISIREEDFYQPFADWLVHEIEESTKAIPLGGNKFRDKWGTPDVIGIRESLRSDIIKFPTEIISAELKIDTKDLITAFGQACSYKLFSHKCYIVIPKSSSQEDISRLDALCLIFSIGLVLFDNRNIYLPQFEIRVRPLKHDPDMFYVNRYMKLIEKELF